MAEAIALAAIDNRSNNAFTTSAKPKRPPCIERIRQIAAEFGWNGRVVIVPDDELPDDLKITYLRQQMVMDTTLIRNELRSRANHRG